MSSLSEISKGVCFWFESVFGAMKTSVSKLRGSSKANVMKKINQKANDSGTNDGELKLVSSTASNNKTSGRRKRLVNTKQKVCELHN